MTNPQAISGRKRLSRSERPGSVAVIGGGIVGLATAYKLLRNRPNLSVTLLEKEDSVAFHQTGHNSGVIHSGLYYKPGSEKARLCVRGRSELLRFCEQHSIAHEVCGKVVVACEDEEAARLSALHERGIGNGLIGLRMLSPAEVKEREPHVRCTAALLVPETGIVDFAQAARVLAAEIEKTGGRVITGARITRAVRRGEWHVETTSSEYSADFLVTCAGLQADRVARMAGARPRARVVPFRGDYFGIRPQRAHLVRHLVYPVPNPLFPFLGVHATRAIDGHRHVGPTASLALAREVYRRFALRPADAFSALTFGGLWKFLLRHRAMVRDGIQLALSKSAFVSALQRLVPEFSADDLEHAESGIRAQAMLPDGSLVADFLFEEDVAALHVLNAPSPAATASLAIGSVIAERVLGRMK